MTTIYFVRHAEPVRDRTLYNTGEFPLPEKGLKDTRFVTEFLSDKNIDVMYSSPYKRAVDTIIPFASSVNKDVLTREDFSERQHKFMPDFWEFIEMQWNDFEYKVEGESLQDVQKRNISELQNVIGRHSGQNVVIGTHGGALSTIIKFYNPDWSFDDYKNSADKMPWIVKMIFSQSDFISMEMFDIV